MGSQSSAAQATHADSWATNRQRTERVAVPLTPEELEEIKSAAKRDETTLAAFFRAAALRVARTAVGHFSEAAIEAALARENVATNMLKALISRLRVLERLEKSIRALRAARTEAEGKVHESVIEALLETLDQIPPTQISG
jgi:uncharacterized protein (DUF1778 family)